MMFFRRWGCRVLLTYGVICSMTAPAGEPSPTLDYRIERDCILEHDDGRFLWFHPRAAAGPEGEILLTLQQHLHQSDFYSGLFVLHSQDNGRSWTAPEAVEALAWRMEANGEVIAVCDVTPGWHAKTWKYLAIGIQVRYRDGKQLTDKPLSHAPAYAVYDPAAKTWSPWRLIDVPGPQESYYSVNPGCCQWLVEADGSLLIPVYYLRKGDPCASTLVLQCAFDGNTLSCSAMGDAIALEVPRGIYEPSLTRYANRYWLTMRHDHRAYFAVGEDGLHFAPKKAWTFDDGEEIGSYNTQQHWVTHSEGLFLVYTRRGANNDHIMRHRAPLFIAQVDTARGCLIRATERVVIPERGATLGNFGVAAISPKETWITVSEGVWKPEARKRGATGCTWIGRLGWNRPNALFRKIP